MKPHERIEKYFEACTKGSAAEISSHFTPDAVVYDMNHSPIRNSKTIGEFWVRIRSKWESARWLVNTCITEKNASAIEWSMTGKHEGREFCVRGSEHYEFEGTKISEIRQYWHFDPEFLNSELQSFPYQSDPRFMIEK